MYSSNGKVIRSTIFLCATGGKDNVDNDNVLLYIWNLEDARWESPSGKGVSLSSPDTWVLQNSHGWKKELSPACCSHMCAIMPASVCTCTISKCKKLLFVCVCARIHVYLSVCHLCSLTNWGHKMVLDPLKLYVGLEISAGNCSWILWKRREHP